MNVTATIVDCVPPDTTPPTASPIQDPTANSYGWNNTDVTVTWNWVDNAGGSGIDPANCTTSSTSAGEGVIDLAASCNDLAGNTGNASYTVKVDMTDPTITGEASPAANGYGWTNTDVTVSFTCGDALSGVASCNPDQTLTGEGTGQSVDGTVTDLAGNSASTTVGGINIDRTAPTVVVTGVADGEIYTKGAVPAAGCSTTDALSGVQTHATVAVTGGAPADPSVGTFTATCSGGKDEADNVAASAGVTYYVHYSWAGFFQPVDNLPTVNIAKAGNSIPVKFNLGGYQDLNIFQAGYPSVSLYACGSTLGDEIETYTAGNSSLTYDFQAQQYVYVWKTEKSYAPKCGILHVMLIDGEDHTANFRFK